MVWRILDEHRASNDVAIELDKHHVLQKGDRVLLRTPGGGGIGNPEERSEVFINEDAVQGYV